MLSTFNQKKALVIVKTGCGTDGALHNTALMLSLCHCHDVATVRCHEADPHWPGAMCCGLGGRGGTGAGGRAATCTIAHHPHSRQLRRTTTNTGTGTSSNWHHLAQSNITLIRPFCVLYLKWIRMPGPGQLTPLRKSTSNCQRAPSF